MPRFSGAAEVFATPIQAHQTCESDHIPMISFATDLGKTEGRFVVLVRGHFSPARKRSEGFGFLVDNPMENRGEIMWID
ncbi:hypothetical protein OEZ60_13260 [Defluviimonas sp. WL0024]|uniref:Uncharacterized protein n=1 Tax=Albidovulum salinarum TaxID=2984153 RepID=A0ABT2X4W0_9RHOB|nr:hypothetical protein [Defluviimonas sp. WL0024]MCU9848972.1 hypothetical protein [Defluviimonas sp. WL0024]